MALALDSCSDYCSSSFIQTVPFFDSAGSLALRRRISRYFRFLFAAHPHHRSSSFAAVLLLLPSFATAFFCCCSSLSFPSLLRLFSSRCAFWLLHSLLLLSSLVLRSIDAAVLLALLHALPFAGDDVVLYDRHRSPLCNPFR